MEQNEILKAISPKAGAKNVLVVGGGISGLALAYYLMQRGPVNVTVLESTAEIGGNCKTYDVMLSNNIQRWADMGVNDYNKTSYKLLNQLMAATGYNQGNVLEDTESYGNSDGSVCYTNDGANFTPMSAQVAADSAKFKAEAYKDWQLQQYAHYSLERYVAEKGYSQDYIFNNLYPRVNGMYFCAGSPAEMPFRIVMSYYSLQEGYGSGAQPDRRYFTGGTKTWINSVEALLNKTAGNQVVYKNVSGLTVIPASGGNPPSVRYQGSVLAYDAVVMAMKADEALMAFDGGPQNIPDDIMNILSAFEYVTDETVVHTDSRTLQPQVNSWRTYNIHVFDSKHFNYGPYTITYVANRHQNDCANPAYKNQCEYPQFLISCNPQVEPADSSVLMMPDGKTQARKTFRHQKLNNTTLLAQDALHNSLQGKYGLWYANGYAKGAGLHEECLQNAEELSYLIMGMKPPKQYHFNTSANAMQYAPDYVINAHSENE